MNVTPFTLLGFGFLLGIKHAFDADHVAAISAIASKYNSINKSSVDGMLWGIGHAIPLFFIGLIILIFKISIPQKMALSFEFLVGIMLILLGLNVLITVKKNKLHFHRHKHQGKEHLHFHSHKLANHHNHSHQSIFIGMIHGLAGSAALSLLVLTTLSSILSGVIYILLFGIGSMLGMILISGIISLPFALIPKKLERTQILLKTSAGLTSILLGSIIVYEIAIVIL